MRLTGGVLVLGVLGLGVGVGYGAGALQAAGPAADSARARPAVASSPRVPLDRPRRLQPDPDLPPLPTGLTLMPQGLGVGEDADTVLVPQGWVRTARFSNEGSWVVPDHPVNTYALRMTQVDSRQRTATELLDDRVRALGAAVDDLKVLARDADALEFTFVDDRHLRHAFLRWLDLGGSEDADLEIALVGRERDAAGMADLMPRLVSGALG